MWGIPLREELCGQLAGYICRYASERCGLRCNPHPKTEVIEDAYGEETVKIRFYFEVPTVPSGGTLRVDCDLTRNEEILSSIHQRPVHYGYSDRRDYGEVLVHVYSLEEIAAEKLRAILYQRVQPSPKDLYDLWVLGQEGEVNWDVVRSIFPQKCRSRGIDPSRPPDLEARRDAIAGVWRATLGGLLPEVPDFEVCWEAFENLIETMVFLT